VSLEGAIRTRLLAATGVTNLVARRIYWEVRAQGSALPDVTLTVVSDPRDQHFAGFQGSRGTWIQIDCRGANKDEAIAVRDAVLAAVVPAATVGSAPAVTFQRAQEVRSRASFERATTGDVTGQFREMIELTLWHDG
jgi:hypothetical protein